MSTAAVESCTSVPPVCNKRVARRVCSYVRSETTTAHRSLCPLISELSSLLSAFYCLRSLDEPMQRATRRQRPGFRMELSPAPCVEHSVQNASLGSRRISIACTPSVHTE